MAKKLLNLPAGLSNAKTRTFVILFGTVIIAGIGLALFRSGGSTPADLLAKQGSQTVGIPSSIKSTPGSVVPEKYQELQKTENERRAQEALQKKTSAIPTIIGAIATEPGGNENTEALINNALKGTELEGNADIYGKSARDKARELQEATTKAQQEKQLNDQRAKAAAEQAERDRAAADAKQKADLAAANADVQKLSQQMKNYAGGAYNEWNKIVPQAYVRGELADKEYKIEEIGTTKTGITGPNNPLHTGIGGPISRAGSPSSQFRVPRQKLYIKAGSVLFGVLDTSVNSDEPGPILATVVAGKYSGSKLVGTFTHQPQQESVVITFSTMSLPKYSKSFSVQAVAIDPETARTALASDVDRHLLLRYGTLFASSFISGYGKAIQNQGTTTTSPLTGTTTTTTPMLSNKQIFESALGTVGTQWGQATLPYFNTPYTVSVNQGAPVGLLFLSDVELSSDLQIQGEIPR